MKIAVNADAESTVVGVESGRMNFDTSKQAKLFHMLSSSLYSNKPRSILRELCSNAHDSHVLVGIAATTPFKVVAPTYETPLLVVKDYGVGLTKEEAYNTILCYLGSTKDQSSDFIGGWGIGSKSPFAYTKSYNVVCVKDGKRVEFACWKDEHGLPTSAVVDERDTDEPNGVEMHVPVMAGDVRTFRTAITSYMQWTNYNVVADMGDFHQLKPLEPMETVDYHGLPISLFKSDDGGKIRLVYGGESYDIKDCINKETDTWERWEKLLESMDDGFNIAVVMNTPDSVDFNMNREELEQTPRTVALINKIVDFLGEEAAKRVDVYDSKMKATIGMSTDGEGVRKTLAEISAEIDRIISEGDSADRVFARAFRIFESTYRFDIGYSESLHALSQRSGVHRLHSLSYMVKPLCDQITVAYGRTFTPSKRDRDDFFYKRRRGMSAQTTNVIYVRATTKEEAIAVLNSSPSIGNFDWTGVDFHFFNIPLPTRSSSVRTGRTPPPRIYEAIAKEYIPFTPSNIYVMRRRGDEIDAETEMLLQIGAMALTPSYKYKPIIFFTPTSEFLKRDHPSNVISMDKAEGAWMEAANDYLAAWGGISFKGMTGFRRCEISTLSKESKVDVLSIAFNAAVDRAARDYGRVCRVEGDVAQFVADWREGGGVLQVQGLVNVMGKIRKIHKDVAMATEFIDMRKLIRNRSTPAARKLIATLKIGEWI